MTEKFCIVILLITLNAGCALTLSHDRSLSDNTRQAAEFNRRGNDFFFMGQYDLAIREYKKAIQLYPRYAKAHSNLGYALLEKKEYDRALVEFSRAIESNPRYARAYNNRGLVFFAKGQYDRAVLDYNRAIELDPELAKPYDNRGTIYMLTGKIEKACSDFVRACDLGECSTYEMLADNGYCNFSQLAMSIPW